MRLPVAAKIAFVSAGTTGGSAGSPRPVGALPERTQWTSISGGAWVIRSSGKSWKFDWTVRPRSIVISCPMAYAMPSSTAPCTCCSAPLGLMIWLPMSPATQTLSTLTRPSRVTVASTTSAK